MPYSKNDNSNNPKTQLIKQLVTCKCQWQNGKVNCSAENWKRQRAHNPCVSVSLEKSGMVIAYGHMWLINARQCLNGLGTRGSRTHSPGGWRNPLHCDILTRIESVTLLTVNASYWLFLTRSFLCRKSRNLSEKKRRDQFNSLVNDLSALISTSSRKMDKSTVLKSTIAFLKNHNGRLTALPLLSLSTLKCLISEATDRSKVFEIQQDWKPAFLSNDEYTHLMLESLDGFMMVFSSMGSIFYASESITSQLGYLPVS